MKSLRSRIMLRIGLAVIAMLLAIKAGTSGTTDDAESKEFYAVVYAINDLPVYRIDKNPVKGFDPSILFAVIRNSRSAESWRDGAGMSAYPQNLSIVVSQNEANHAKLVTLLESLRANPNK